MPNRKAVNLLPVSNETTQRKLIINNSKSGATDKKLLLKTMLALTEIMPGNRDLLKVVRGRTQSLLRSCYHTFSKSLLGSVKGV